MQPCGVRACVRVCAVRPGGRAQCLPTAPEVCRRSAEPMLYVECQLVSCLRHLSRRMLRAHG
jgi:hypothetical protein